VSTEHYEPSDWGKLFHSLTTDEALGAGSAGPGKSFVLLMDPIAQVIVEHQRCLNKDHPNPLRWGQSRGWALHLRRQFPMLEQTISRSKRIFKSIDPDARWDEQKHMWIFRSGYRYQFGHCKDRDDWEQYHSNEYTHIAYDELVQFEFEQYSQINTRLRSADPVLKDMLRIRAMSNPFLKREGNYNITVNDPHWVRKRFVEPAPEGRKILKKKIKRRDGRTEFRTRIYVPATLYDNPDPVFVEQYEATLLDKPPHIRQAMLYGNWYITEGSFFGEDWNEQLHVCKPFNIPPDWPRFRSMDWGYKTHGVVLWWAMDPDGTMYCEREFSFRLMSPTNVAKRIQEYERGAGLWKDGRSIITGPADTQLWEQRGDSGMTKAQEMASEGVTWAKADKRSRARNSQQLLERLRDHGGGLQMPGIVWFETCKMCRQTIPSIQPDHNDPECPQDGGEDHWLDTCLYAAAYASRGHVGISSRRNERGYDQEQRRLEATEGGRYGYGAC
jgi:hypothetical protein